MSDGNIVNDWIDADELRRVAEDLLAPTDEITQEKKDAATFSDDFVGFAEVGKKADEPEAQNLAIARETLSKAQDTAKSAGIIPGPKEAAPAASSPGLPGPSPSSPPVAKPESITPPAVSVAPAAKSAAKVAMHPPSAPPAAAKLAATAPPKTAPSVTGKPVTPSKETKLDAAGLTQKAPKAVATPALGADGTGIKSPFRIVDIPVSKEYLTGLPRSV